MKAITQKITQFSSYYEWLHVCLLHCVESVKEQRHLHGWQPTPIDQMLPMDHLVDCRDVVCFKSKAAQLV
jgi:hypothetical protein